MVEQVFAANPALETAFEAGVDVRLGVSVLGRLRQRAGPRALPGRWSAWRTRTRSWMCGFERLILATGARDVALAFRAGTSPA